MESPESKPRPPEEGAQHEGVSIAGERFDVQILGANAAVVNGCGPTELTPDDLERQVRAHVEFLGIAPARVREIRVLDYDGQDARASGYFDDLALAVRAILAVPPRSGAVLVTLNALPALPSGCAHNLITKHPKHATGDHEITARTHVLIDIDPVRAVHGAATEPERAAAASLADEITGFLEGAGIQVAARLDTGNGQALLIKVDLPARDSELTKRFLESLSLRFDTTGAHVDASVFNPSRLTRIAGTWNRKGDDTEERPHRRARLLDVNPNAAEAQRDALESVVGNLPPAGRRNGRPVVAEKLDVSELLARNGVAVHAEGPWKGGYRWALSECRWDSTHRSRSAFVIQFADGGVTAGCLNTSCGGRGWREFNATLAHPAPEQTLVSNVGAHPGGKPDSWPNPQALPGNLPPVARFEMDLLPSVLRDWVEDASHRMGCPPEYVAVACLIVLATVIGRRIGIRPKRFDVWLVVVNLWGLIVGRPGVLKTPGLQEGMRALERLEKREKLVHEKALRKYATEKVIAEEMEKRTKKTIRERLEEGVAPEKCADGLIFVSPEPPVRVRYKTNDSTVEKLGEILEENPNGILVFRDEVVGFIKSLDKEGHEGARSFYLEAWNGTGSFTYDRIGRGTIDIDAAIVSILGGVQPGPLNAYLAQALEGGFGDDGLLQRFQLAVYPDTGGPYVNVDVPPNGDAREKYFQLVESLTAIKPVEWGAEPSGSDPDSIPYLHFADDAQVVFDDWRTEFESRLRSGADVPALESHLAKYRSLLPSLALILHLAEGPKGPVSTSALRLALRWLVYLESHARRIYAGALQPEARVGQLLAKHLLDGDIQDGFALREVYRNGWSGLTTKDDSERAVQFLVDYDWLHEAREQGERGAPRTRYWINPGIAAFKRKSSQGPSEALTSLTESEEGLPSEAAGEEPWGEVL